MKTSLYDNGFWCGNCGRKIPKTEALAHNGGFKCPQCHKTLRTKPRMYGKRKPKTSTLGDIATSIQTLHEGGGFPTRSAKLTVAESNIKHAKPLISGKPCSLNMESHQKAGVLKK